jgi:hypothetical protein
MSARLALVVACALGSALARADDHVALAGTELSGLGTYTYLGIVSPLGDSRLGHGLVMRHWLERLTYEYDGPGGANIEAERYGYAPALGWQMPLGEGSAALYAGLRFAHTDLDPNDSGNDEAGHTNRVFLQADAFTPVGERVENQFVGSFETRYSDYYVRDRLLFRFDGKHAVGPEVILKGGRDYEGWQAGLAVGGFRIFERVGLLVRGGISGQQGESSTGYGSLEFVMGL